MAKDRKKLQHIHSSVPDKQPTAASLEVGEIAVNNAENQEFLSIKNSNDKVVRFSSDEQMVTIMEKKEVMPYSGTVDNVHLDTNRSNIEIKLNQVVAGNTVKHDVVNGARDIDGDLVNPTSDSGLTDGAGFAIDMSRYAMIGANPSFSSVTVTHQSNLSGTTNITNGEGGTTLNIETTNVNVNDTNWTEEITTKNSTMEGHYETATTRTAVVGDEALTVSGITTENHNGNVEINNSADVTENTTGDVVINITGTTTETKVGNVVENHSGTTTENFDGKWTVNAEGGTEILSCTKFEITTDNFSIKQCDGSSGSASFDYCAGYEINSNNLEFSECDGGEGSLTINETATNINGETLTIRESGATDISGQSLTITETDGININSSASTNISSNEGIGINADDDVCATAGSIAAFVGSDKTNVGVDCSDNGTTAELNLNGTTINEVGTTVNINGTNQINVNGGTVNEEGSTKNSEFTVMNNVADNFNITGTTYISGDTTIDGDLYLTVDCFNSGITSTTVNAAICETLDRSVVTMTTETPTASSEILKTYKLWQNGLQIGEDINIPKDHLLKSAGIVYGELSGDTFTPCDVASSDCHWYIKLVWNVFDPSTGHADDKTTYMPADDFIKDIDDSNPAGIVADSYDNIVMDVWYDGEKNLVSATTTPTIHASQNIYADGNMSATTITASDAINANELTTSGNVNISNIISVNTAATQCVTIDRPLCINGTITADGAIWSSDRDLKKDINLISREEINKVKNIPLKSYILKDDDENYRMYGIIAQEAQDAGLSDIVRIKEDGKFGVDYISFLILRNAYLEDFCANLNGRLVELENKLNKLENKD